MTSANSSCWEAVNSQRPLLSCWFVRCCWDASCWAGLVFGYVRLRFCKAVYLKSKVNTARRVFKYTSCKMKSCVSVFIALFAASCVWLEGSSLLHGRRTSKFTMVRVWNFMLGLFMHVICLNCHLCIIISNRCGGFLGKTAVNKMILHSWSLLVYLQIPLPSLDSWQQLHQDPHQ